MEIAQVEPAVPADFNVILAFAAPIQPAGDGKFRLASL